MTIPGTGLLEETVGEGLDTAGTWAALIVPALKDFSTHVYSTHFEVFGNIRNIYAMTQEQNRVDVGLKYFIRNIKNNLSGKVNFVCSKIGGNQLKISPK